MHANFVLTSTLFFPILVQQTLKLSSAHESNTWVLSNGEYFESLCIRVYG